MAASIRTIAAVSVRQTRLPARLCRHCQLDANGRSSSALTDRGSRAGGVYRGVHVRSLQLYVPAGPDAPDSETTQVAGSTFLASRQSRFGMQTKSPAS